MRRGGRWLAGIALAALVGMAAGVVYASGDDSYPRAASPPGALLYIVDPAPGATVTNPVTVRFGLSGMGVAPSGVKRESTGHHHLLLDTSLPPMNAPVPANDHYVHFGGGQTEVTLELSAGTHTLQLLLGDENHVPHKPPVVSEKITITVE